jgi:stage V sporulation protein B
MSGGFLAATVAVSGIRFAATRIISEELGLGRHGGVTGAVRRCLGYSLFFGISAMLILYFTAEPVAFLWIGDARTVLSLKIMSFSMPFLSFPPCCPGILSPAGGYQIGRHPYVRTAGAGRAGDVLSEHGAGGDLENSCAAVVLGGLAAEVFSFLMIFVLYVFDKRLHGKVGRFPESSRAGCSASPFPWPFRPTRAPP